MDSLGIDIGGTSVKLALLRDGAVQWTGQSARFDRPDTDQLIAAMHEAAGDKAIRAEVAGVCVPGILDKSKRIITLAVNVPGVMNIVLDELVARAFGPVRVEIINDAIAAATDFQATHQLTGRLLALSIGTGVGAAVLDDGVPLLVEGESPGHIGMLDVSVLGAPVIGPDGGAGSLEGYLGARAIGQIDRLDESSPPIRALVRAIRICHAIYRPHHVVLLGGNGIRMGSKLDLVRTMVNDKLTNVARAEWTLRCGDSDFHAALGAARIAARSSS